ncbi:MAG TPA: type I phosphomannose isomerase catalytic subunit [Verrucomicrobiae bacterium]
MLYPFVFQPIFKDRIWGGRELKRLYGKKIPAGQPTGEAWEISDRPGDASVIANGSLAGKDLRWLMENHAAEILGAAKPAAAGRFPLLCKILDAREKLSLQVHPPASKAKELKGEPKTEMWFIAEAAPDARLYVGLKKGVTRAEFEQKISDGSVADCFHRIPVKAGDTMFLPSGRVHAIGDGLVIFEIQQNSDTTYRVFDWNRVGLDGQPRELHLVQSLASIDFNDFEPKLVPAHYRQAANFKFRQLVEDPLFNVQEMVFENAGTVKLAGQLLRIIAVVKGSAAITGGGKNSVELKSGQFCLFPASLKNVEIKTSAQTSFLCTEPN